jgi:sulfur relay (sulfurtransferase) DsrC/TusE family protein
LIPQVKCKNQFANLGQREKSLSRLFNPMNGPIKQAIKLANTPEVR